jgi:hypothetical protein
MQPTRQGYNGKINVSKIPMKKYMQDLNPKLSEKLDPDPKKIPTLEISVYPGSRFLPIPDPGSKNSNERQG